MFDTLSSSTPFESLTLNDPPTGKSGYSRVSNCQHPLPQICKGARPAYFLIVAAVIFLLVGLVGVQQCQNVLSKLLPMERGKCGKVEPRDAERLKGPTVVAR